MNREMIDRVRSLFTKARKDPEYAKLSEEYGKCEKEFDELTRKMTDDEQNIAWGFVCLSDQMNWRMMELVCEWFDVDEDRK